MHKYLTEIVTTTVGLLIVVVIIFFHIQRQMQIDHTHDNHLTMHTQDGLWFVTNDSDLSVTVNSRPITNGLYTAQTAPDPYASDPIRPDLDPERTTYAPLRRFRNTFPLTLRSGESLAIGTPPTGIDVVNADVEITDTSGTTTVHLTPSR